VSDDPDLAGAITGIEVIAGDAATQALPTGRLPTAVANAVNYQLLAGEQILLLDGVPRDRLGVVKQVLDPALASTGPIGGVTVTAGTTYALAVPHGGEPPAGHVDRITGALLSLPRRTCWPRWTRRDAAASGTCRGQSCGAWAMSTRTETSSWRPRLPAAHS